MFDEGLAPDYVEKFLGYLGIPTYNATYASDADDAIRRLDRIEFGRKGRRLRVEWSKDHGSRRPEISRKPAVNTRPSKTLFVINFDPVHTRTRDIESKFMDRVISVEFAIRDNDERRNVRSPDKRGRDMSPDRRGYDRRRSPSPYRRDRGSPDDGHGAPLNSSRSPPPRERSRS